VSPSDDAGKRPPRLVQRWEALSVRTQIAIVFAPAAVLLFATNLGPFHQPLWRSVLYGLVEAVPITALVVIATVNERSRRRDG
jgi:hypothetical protein